MSYNAHLDDSRLTPGVIDGSAQNIFLQGGCAILAIALHDATGWAIIGITDRHNVYGDQIGGGSCLHWCVKTPDGQFLDILGLRSPEDVVEAYHGEADEDEETGEPTAGYGISSRENAWEWYVEQGSTIPLTTAKAFVPAVLTLVSQMHPTNKNPDY